MNYKERFQSLPRVMQHLIHELHMLAHMTCDNLDDLIKLAESEKNSNWKFSDPEKLRSQVKARVQDLEKLELHMQKAWGFPEDKNWHTWWCRPKSCTCPKLDNWERAGVADRITAVDCPLHGHSKLWTKEVPEDV